MRRTHGTNWGSQLREECSKRQTGGLPQANEAGFSQQIHDLLQDGEVGEDAIGKASKSSWWSWDQGLTLFFWCWPAGEQRKAAQDGMDAYITGSFPSHQAHARQTKSDVYKLLLPKIQKILDRGYVRF
jgi:hypothetical protein